MNYKTVIGLEVHAELNTQSKIYCSCTTAFGGAENTHVCPICAGMPGTLPMLNEKAVEYCVRAGLALNCQISRCSKQDRKHYFYPDLPKAFQTSQFDMPLCLGGYVDIVVGGQPKRIGITRIHIEEDAGKLIHGEDVTRVDYNRCGVPLIEIVTEPDFENSAQVHAFLEELRWILLYTGVCNGKMEEGSLRCDVNLSIHKEGEPLGTRTEMKNLNSFGATVRAVEYEERRQREVLEKGGVITQDTLRWDDAKGYNYVMRSKEDADEYFYFPEPDILPIVLSGEYIEKIRSSLPVLPAQRRSRYIRELGLSEYDARILTMSRFLSDFFEETVALGAPAKQAANYVMGDINRLLNDRGMEPEQLPVKAENLVGLIELINRGTISNSTGAKVIEMMFDQPGKTVAEIVKEQGMAQVSDENTLRALCEKVIEENPKAAADYKGGTEKALRSLVGQAMRLSKGKANPGLVNQIMMDLLK
jgi:aspartyl-tRNA(Asn)/glutamyl-tRNA(Gln) amidotransferase subunit B